MGRKSKYEVKPVCKECGKEQNQNKDLSNENWNVYDTKCPECGGKIDVSLYENGIKVE